MKLAALRGSSVHLIVLQITFTSEFVPENFSPHSDASFETAAEA